MAVPGEGIPGVGIPRSYMINAFERKHMLGTHPFIQGWESPF